MKYLIIAAIVLVGCAESHYAHHRKVLETKYYEPNGDVRDDMDEEEERCAYQEYKTFEAVWGELEGRLTEEGMPSATISFGE